MPSKEDDLRSFQQLTAELRDPVLTLLRTGEEHLVSELS
jgi:hypothetical protein